MSDVLIKSYNQLYVSVVTHDKSIHLELNDHFSFFVDGYKHMPLFKSGAWDGKKKLYQLNRRVLYKGLLIDLIRFLDSRGYSYTLDKTGIRPIDVRDDIKTFFGDFSSLGNSAIIPRDYQKDAVTKSLTFNKSIILSPTASGKSLIIYMLVLFLLKHTEGKILITVPTISLVTQLSKDFQDYQVDLSDDDKFDVHRVTSGVSKDSEKRVTVSTWQSIFRQPEEWFQQFDSYICDEAHLADATSITGIVENLAHVNFKFGLTGTLDGTKTHELVLRGLFGPVIKTTTSSELMDDGILAKLEIEMLKLSYPLDEIKSMKKTRTYDDEIKWLVGNQKRNNLLVDLALSQSNNTLVLFNLVGGHGDQLFKAAKDHALAVGKQVFIISGKDKAEERERIRQVFEENNNCVLFASFGVYSTGVNVKNLHTVIFAHPYKSKIRNLQSIGRALRVSSEKTTAKLIDIIDDLTYNKKNNITFLHAIERMKIYEQENFVYRVVNRDI